MTEVPVDGGPAALAALAAAGASGSNLYDMGAVLQAIQGVCQHAGCALLVVTHWNKTGDGRGADRISGAGPAGWARVICSVAIQHRGSGRAPGCSRWRRGRVPVGALLCELSAAERHAPLH
ncbi:MAG TPA: hypothetical protein VK942_15530 [Actinomycetes bacterium]|nr:hypothetical protein [Actinomycetes bacterium]